MKKSKMMLGSAMVLAVLLVAGGTLAWFTASTEAVENKFTAGVLEIELVDIFDGAPNVNPGDCYEKNVFVNNIGSKRAVVRIKKDMVLISNPNGPADINLSMDVVLYELGENWEEIDGYFYYNAILDPSVSTTSLFKDNKICFAGQEMGNDYQGAELTIRIEAEAIQATNGAPTDSGWAIDPLNEGPQ